MTAWADLVREIRAEPEIDAPRLVAADWLTERDDPRGECIVLDLRLAHLDLAAPDRSALLAHRATIANEEAWAAPLRALHASSARGKRTAPFEFRRGFIQAIALAGRAALDFPACTQLEPIIELVIMTAGPRNFVTIGQMPELAQIRYLAIGRGHSDGIEALLESPHLANVRTLVVPAMITPDLARSIANGVMRPHTIAPRSSDVETARVLATTGLLERAIDLEITSDALAEAYAAAPLAGLRKLRVTRDYTARTFAALGERLDRLTALHCVGGWDATIVPLMLRYMTSRSLTTLSLSSFTDDSIVRLIRSPVIANVVDLELIYGTFTRAVAEALMDTPYRMNLRSLWIAGAKNVGTFRLDGVAINRDGW